MPKAYTHPQSDRSLNYCVVCEFITDRATVKSASDLLVVGPFESREAAVEWARERDNDPVWRYHTDVMSAPTKLAPREAALRAAAAVRGSAEPEHTVPATWAGLVEFLDAYLFAGESGDHGAQIVVLTREIDRLTRELDLDEIL